MRTSARGARRRRAESRLDIVRGRCPTSTQSTSPNTPLDRRDPGALRGRDGHAPALHDRSAPTPRARSPRAHSRCRRSGFAIGPIFKSTPHRWEDGRHGEHFSEDNYVPVIVHADPGDRRGGQDDRVRAQVQPDDRHGPVRQGHAVHRDLQPLRAPRLPGALGGRRRALHLPVPRRRLRPARQARRRPAGAPARPLLHARGGRIRRSSARASASTASCDASRPRDPGEPLDGIGQYLYPSRPSAQKL